MTFDLERLQRHLNQLWITFDMRGPGRLAGQRLLDGRVRHHFPRPLIHGISAFRRAERRKHVLENMYWTFLSDDITPSK